LYKSLDFSRLLLYKYTLFAKVQGSGGEICVERYIMYIYSSFCALKMNQIIT
jgi:hypothetical protein